MNNYLRQIVGRNEGNIEGVYGIIMPAKSYLFPVRQERPATDTSIVDESYLGNSADSTPPSLRVDMRTPLTNANKNVFNPVNDKGIRKTYLKNQVSRLRVTETEKTLVFERSIPAFSSQRVLSPDNQATSTHPLKPKETKRMEKEPLPDKSGELTDNKLRHFPVTPYDLETRKSDLHPKAIESHHHPVSFLPVKETIIEKIPTPNKLVIGKITVEITAPAPLAVKGKERIITKVINNGRVQSNGGKSKLSFGLGQL